MNPAQRLLELVDFFSSQGRDKSTHAIWVQYVYPQGPAASEDDVLGFIQAALLEIRTMESQLKGVRVPEHLFSNCSRHLRDAFSPRHLATNWNQQHASNIQNASVRVILQWASWTLGRLNENPIDPEAWSALIQALAAHEELLNGTAGIPPGIRAMLERQITELRQAMAMYKLQGVAPIQSAVNQAVGELGTATPELVSELESSPKPVKSLFQKGKELVGQAAELSDKGSKVTKFGREIYELGSTAWTFGTQYLGQS